MGGALGGANISTAPTTNLYCRKHFKALKVIKTYVGGEECLVTDIDTHSGDQDHHISLSKVCSEEEKTIFSDTISQEEQVEHH